MIVRHRDMKTALDLNTIYVKRSKNAENNGKIAIFINKSLNTFAITKGGGSNGQINKIWFCRFLRSTYYVFSVDFFDFLWDNYPGKAYEHENFI
jgi:hypothetical protein